MIRTLNILVIVLIAISRLNAQPLKYPVTNKVDQQDTYFGTSVSDPYRWLENDRSAETEQWVETQNKITGDYLKQIPFRDSLRSRMKQLWSFPQFDTPFRCGSSYFYFRNDGTQNQPVLFYMRSLEYVPMAYFDPNKLSADGTTSITSTVASKDGMHIAFMVSEAGSDWNSIRIKEVKTMKTLPEKLNGIKFSNIAWYKNGFFYSRFDTIPGGKALTDVNEYHKIYYHHLNTPQADDSLVFEDKKVAQRNYAASVTEDERFLIISGTASTTGNSIAICELNKKGSKLIQLVNSFENDFDLIGNLGDNLIFQTNYKAPKNKIILINSKNPLVTNWKDLVPEQEEILKSAVVCSKNLLLHYMKDATSKLYGYSMQGQKKFSIPFNEIGTITSISGSVADTNVFISYSTFTSPPKVYRYNMNNNRLYVQFKSELPYNVDAYETKQVFYNSKDGTKIPMFLVGKKGLIHDGNTPTLLYGYGGFNISKTPEFKAERLVFLEQGGLLALPCLRGGGEYGSAWHEAGTLLKKQNVFDDFIAAAEYLIKEKYTNPSKLAISGRSNGGLLVGAVMTQRPELFKVALPAVGVMDMLRFHKFTIGWAWKTDYGSSDDSTQFKALYAYSPLHNIKPEINYPATMVTTADHDDRVVPAHSFKFISTLQEKHHGDNPVLIRIDTNAGHGSGKPIGKLIDEQSDIFSFLMYNLGMTYEKK